MSEGPSPSSLAAPSRCCSLYLSGPQASSALPHAPVSRPVRGWARPRARGRGTPLTRGVIEVAPAVWQERPPPHQLWAPDSSCFLPLPAWTPRAGKASRDYECPSQTRHFVNHALHGCRKEPGQGLWARGPGGGGCRAARQASEALASLLQVHPFLPHPLHVLQRLFHSHQS